MPNAAAGQGTGSSRSSQGRRVYRQSQGTAAAAAAASPALKVKEVVSAVAPAGAFVVVTFGIFCLLSRFLSRLLDAKNVTLNGFECGHLAKLINFY